MKESVRIKCSKKHNDEVGYFDLTPDMIITNGNMVRARCPECNASVLLSWKNVADLLETTVEEAKAQLQNGTVPKIAVVPTNTMPEPEMPTVLNTPVNAYSEMLTSTEKPPAERAKVITRMEEPEPTNTDSPSTIGDTMGGFSVSEVDKTTNEVLADVIRSQPGLNKTVVDEVIEYIALKPEGWPPNMVKMILEAYKVTPTVCDVVVARYGMKLNMIEQKRRGMDQLRGMLPNPNSTIPGYGNSNPGFPPGGNPFNAVNPQNMGQQNLGMGPGNMGMPQVSTQQMWMAYQQDPNSFFAWLTNNPQYIPAWQQFFQQMQGMGMGMQRPMVPGIPGMGMMGMGMPSSGAGTSREDVRRMISAEMDQVKAAIQQIVSQNAPKPQQDDTVKTIILPMLLKMMDDKKSDNGPDFTQALLGKLLDKSLEDKGGEMQYVIQKMEEMEKRREEITRATEEARKQANPFSNVNSVDSLETALKLHEVLGNFDIKREELKDKVKQREMWSSVIGGGLDTLGKAFSTVMMVKQGQGGAMDVPVEVPIESTANVSTAVCENCKTKITYAIGTPRVVCPGCNTVYDVVPSGQPPATQLPPPQYERPTTPPHVMVYDGSPEQIPENRVEENSSNAVNITLEGPNQTVEQTPQPQPIGPPPAPKKSRKKDRQDGM